MTKTEREELRRLAEAARDETDRTQPRDIDAVSPYVDKLEHMHAALSPEAVVALLERMRRVEDALRRCLKWEDLEDEPEYVAAEEALEDT